MLKSKFLSNVNCATQFGPVHFNAQGESKDLTKDQEIYLAERIRDFDYIPDKAAKVEAPVEAPVEVTPVEVEAPVEVEPVEVEAPKAAPKKRTAKKAAPKPEVEEK